MKTRGLLFFGLAAATMVGGCGSKTPSGQVVATVGKHEITMRQLRAEIAGVHVTDPKQEKQVEIAGLRNIIGRTILADAARAKKIDKDPDFVLARERADDSMLAEALQRQVVMSVPKAGVDDAQKYIDANPDMFAQRKIFDVDQLRMPRITDVAVLKQLQPLHDLEQIQSALTADKISFQRGVAEIDADSIGPKMTAAMLKLPPGEPFVLPVQKIYTVNVVKSTRVVPFTGPRAIAFAQDLITRERAQTAVQRELRSQFAQGLKKVKFSKDFQAAAIPKPAPAPGSQAPQPGKVAPK